jgi:hypothetical protein
MTEKDIFHYSSIPEDNIQMSSARSNLINSSLPIFLEHTVFDHYQSESGFRIKKVLFTRGKLSEDEKSLVGKEKEEVLKKKRKGIMLKIEHNKRGVFFFIRIKAGSNGEFNYISGAKMGKDGLRRAMVEKDTKLDRTLQPESVNKKLENCLKNCYPKRNKKREKGGRK